MVSKQIEKLKEQEDIKRVRNKISWNSRMSKIMRIQK